MKLLYIVAIILGIIAVGLVVNMVGDLPTPPAGTAPTPTPTPTPTQYMYKTQVVVENPWLGKPRISSVSSTKVGVISGIETEESDTYGLNPYIDDVYVQVVVTYGNKQVFSSEKVHLSISEGSTQDTNFVWTTTNTGPHVVTVTLYDEKNVQIDSSIETVSVGGA